MLLEPSSMCAPGGGLYADFGLYTYRRRATSLFKPFVFIPEADH